MYITIVEYSNSLLLIKVGLYTILDKDFLHNTIIYKSSIQCWHTLNGKRNDVSEISVQNEMKMVWKQKCTKGENRIN